MTLVRFVAQRGAVAARGAAGDRLLDLARAAGAGLEGTCGGQLACATCHVLVDPADAERFAAPTAAEEALLDLVPGATRRSRLACQLRLPAELAELVVGVPG